MKNILVIGGASFVGSNLIKRMFADVKGETIVNIDNMSAYYDVSLKEYSLMHLKVDHHFVNGGIADCQEYGLRAPEFIQAEDFRMIIWRKKKSNQARQKSNSVLLTAKLQKVFEFCDEIPRTAQEILEMVGVKHQTRTLQQYVTQ